MSAQRRDLSTAYVSINQMQEKPELLARIDSSSYQCHAFGGGVWLSLISGGILIVSVLPWLS